MVQSLRPTVRQLHLEPARPARLRSEPMIPNEVDKGADIDMADLDHLR